MPEVVKAAQDAAGTPIRNEVAEANKPTPPPVAKTSETPVIDTAAVRKIENALRARGFYDVTVDVSTIPMALRGTVPKGKMAELLQSAREANGGKPIRTELTEK